MAIIHVYNFFIFLKWKTSKTGYCYFYLQETEWINKLYLYFPLIPLDFVTLKVI